MEAVNVNTIDLTTTYLSEDTSKYHPSPKQRRTKRKYIRHSQRSSEFVQRRNLREKARVHEINRAVDILATYLPLHGTGISVSMINILRYAITYIRELQNMIIEHNSRMPSEAIEDSFGQYANMMSPETANNSMDSDSSTETNLTMSNFENRLYTVSKLIYFWLGIQMLKICTQLYYRGLFRVTTL